MHHQTASLALWTSLLVGIPFASTAVTETQQLVVNAPVAGAGFGSAVALSGTTAVVGASGRTPAGEADVYGFDGSSWSYVTTIAASDGASGDAFGAAVAAFGDRIVVGAPGATVNMLATGAAYVFFDDPVLGWTQEDKLSAADGAAGDRFGTSVAISGTAALIGADQADSATLTDSGSAYAFRRSGTSWAQELELVAPVAADFDFFGASVALSGNLGLIGADGTNADAGAAYVFRNSGATWPFETTLVAADATAGDGFGFSVALSGLTAVIGSEGRGGSGGAYVFRDQGATWVQETVLVASDAAAQDRFGHSVAATATSAIVGALGDEVSPSHNGKAYIFSFDGAAWTQTSQLSASNGALGDLFGNAVAVSGTQVLVGAVRHDGSSLTDSGAAYVFVPEPGALAMRIGALAALAWLGRSGRRRRV